MPIVKAVLIDRKGRVMRLAAGRGSQLSPHAWIASSVKEMVRLPRCLNEASYSDQFVIRYRALGIRWRLSAWYLKGKGRFRRGEWACPCVSPSARRQPGPGPCNNVT